MTQSQLLETIHKNLINGLPGVAAQVRMSPIKNITNIPTPDDHKKAGVVALLYPIEEQMHIVFIIRSSKDKRDKHAGQIGLPGGKQEEGDKNMQETAIRELHEEIGVNPNNLEVLTPLTTRYVVPSNFLIYPFLAITNTRPDFKLQEEEVDDIIEIPLDIFKENIKKTKDITTPYSSLKDIPYYDLQGHTLWGATAMIMSEIEHLIF